MLDLVTAAVTVAVLALLTAPRVRRSEAWRATVTPLASIIGSGFLVVAPLLGGLLGVWAAAGMAAVVVLAHAIGAVVRFNISHVEPLLAAGPLPGLRRSERWSDLALAFAYVTSVAFYTRLLAAFALRAVGIHDDDAADATATVVLAGIAFTGAGGGLRALERLEEYAVNAKLAIIAGFLAALAGHDFAAAAPAIPQGSWTWSDGLRRLAGMLLVVQGFETSRYLGAEHAAAVRVRTMRRAQWLAGAIYVAFVALATPLLGALDGGADETAVIGIAGAVSRILPPLLIAAAVLAQFSAAVADTLGSGGLLAELSRRHVGERTAYVAVCALATALIWSADIFAIIAYASRAFALYYALQCLSAWHAAAALPPRRRRAARTAFALLGVVLLAVAAFALPAEGAPSPTRR